jgi:hypothetical protein|tara:strand:+ start:166 stop:315 length:150 start_codon:yes stop_codon:yes gene_type:complete
MENVIDWREKAVLDFGVELVDEFESIVSDGLDDIEWDEACYNDVLNPGN